MSLQQQRPLIHRCACLYCAVRLVDKPPAKAVTVLRPKRSRCDPAESILREMYAENIRKTVVRRVGVEHNCLE